MTQPANPGRPDPDQVWDALVVGGGIAGLVAARDLAVTGLRTLVLEAWRTPGGVVGRHTVDGLDLDAGAESFATRGGQVADLAGELGLTARVVSPEPHGAWVRLPSGSGPLPRTGLLGIPAHPWAGDVRRTIGWSGSARASLDRLLPARVGVRSGGDDTTLGELVQARMGRRVLDRLVSTVVSGVHAADPEEIAADAVAPGLTAAVRREGALSAAVQAMRAETRAGSAVASFDGGLYTLVEALVADLESRDGRLRCATRAESVTHDDGLFTVTVAPSGAPDAPEPGLTGTLTARRLVVAAPDAVDLLAPVAPDLAGLHTDAGADIVLATLVLDAPALDAHPRGTGVLVSREVHDVRAKALTHATAKWEWLGRAAGPGRHVVRLSYGRTQESVNGSGPLPHDLDALTEVALRDASSILGVPLSDGQVRASARVRWSQGLPVPSAAHQDTVRRVRQAVGRVPGLAVAGAWVAGNGLASVVSDSREVATALTEDADAV